MNFVKSLFGILLALSVVLLAGCTQQASAQQNKTLAFGDTALVDYILTVDVFNSSTNRTEQIVYDTSIAEVANASGIYNERLNYAPLIVKMEANNSLLPGFTRALVGMAEGENKTFLLSPEDSYGPYDPNKSFSIERYYTRSRYDSAPREYFYLNNLSTEVGANLTSAYWDAEVVNVTEDTVTIKYVPVLNKTFVFNGLPQKVVSFDEENITIEVLAEEGKFYETESPSGTQLTVRVVSVNETSIAMDANNPLAGKTLKFTVFVKKIKKA